MRQVQKLMFKKSALYEYPSDNQTMQNYRSAYENTQQQQQQTNLTLYPLNQVGKDILTNPAFKLSPKLAYGGRIMRQKQYQTSEYSANLSTLLGKPTPDQPLKLEPRVVEQTINTSSAQGL